jgi:colanic acid/amylovoran biosynthesis protein
MAMRSIHLVNVGLNNCGDLLMAMTAASKLTQRLGPRGVTVNGRECDAATLRASAQLRRSQLHRLLRLLRPLTRAPGAQGFAAGELVLDCNGYRHGGIWPERNLVDDLALAARVQECRARLVLLPKSCGPFGTGAGAKFAALAERADLLYLRDEESLRLCSPYTSRARLCPDFTIGMPASLPLGHERHGIVVVPNSKLVETGMFDGYESYARFIADCIRGLEGLGQPCSVLFHQTKDVRRLNGPLQRLGIVTSFHDDPRIAKARLASAWLVVSSRYHGALGALTSGTPCLVLGWSHKYAGLLRFYPRGEDWLVPEATAGAVAARGAWISAPAQRAAVLACIAEGNRDITARTEAMWDEVAGLESPR